MSTVRFFLECKGNREEVRQVIEKMQRELLFTTRCHTRRLSLICQGDAISNAFISTQAATEFLLFAIRDLIDQ